MARGWSDAAEWGAGLGCVPALDPLTWPSVHQAGPSVVAAMLTWRQGGLQLALPSVGRETDRSDPQDGGGPTSMPNVLPVEGHRNPATWGKKEKRPSSCASQHPAWSGNPPSALVLPPGQDLSLRTALGAAGWGGAPSSWAGTCLHSTGQGERPQGALPPPRLSLGVGALSSQGRTVTFSQEIL